MRALVRAISVICTAMTLAHCTREAAVDPSVAAKAPPATTAPAVAEREAIDNGSIAPDFTLLDAHGDNQRVTLSKLTAKGPVLLIYYLGYQCPRCVGNLFEITDRKEKFDALGVQIIAASPDTAEATRETLSSQPDFPFPLLDDHEKKLANAYGLVYGDTIMHGLFLITKQGVVQFSMKSSHPYDNFDKILALAKMMKDEP